MLQSSSSSPSSFVQIWGIVTLACTAAFNVLLTVLIFGRLIYFARKYREAFGKTRGTSAYLSPAAMISESAALYTIPAIIQMILALQDFNSYSWSIASAIREMMTVSVKINSRKHTHAPQQAIAPMLITYRVLSGRLLTQEAITELELATSTRGNPGNDPERFQVVESVLGQVNCKCEALNSHSDVHVSALQPI